MASSKRSLGAINLVLLGIGCIIGTGIFVLTGRAAAQFAGPAIMISFVITGLLCAFVALCYAELASALPVSGSAYSYTYASMGEVAAWIMGLLLLLEYGLAASTVAVGWSGYFYSLLQDNMGIMIPPRSLRRRAFWCATRHGAVVATGVINLPAICVIAAVTALLVIGVSESATVNNIVRRHQADGGDRLHRHRRHGMCIPAHWIPLVPAEVPAPPPGTPMDMRHQIGRALWSVVTGDSRSRYGIGGVIHGAAVIFFAYLGFEAVSTAGAESRNPAKDMPIGILGALVICTLLYIATSAVLVGIVPYHVARQPRADRHGRQPDRHAVVRHPGEDRRHRRPLERDAGAALRPDPHLLHHVAGTAFCRLHLAACPQPVQDALDQHHHRRLLRPAALRGSCRSTRSRTSRMSARSPPSHWSASR